MKSDQSGQLRLGIIGCGAVSEWFHVPTILARRDVRLTAVVDRSADRAELLGRKSGAKAFATVAEALPHIDAAIVALPHNLHAPMSIELLAAGKHVLVEKPMAITSAECDAMIAAGKRGGATLTVGQMRRFCPAVRSAKVFIEEGLIGKVKRFEILEGGVFNWQVVSDFQFRKDKAGGGVLMDTGAHTFDMLLWLFGDVVELDYRDDSYGGVEADCEVKLTTASGAKGYVELRRTRNLPTELIIEGDRGRIMVAWTKDQVTLECAGQKLDTFTIGMTDGAGREIMIWEFMFIRQLENWVQSLYGKGAALVPGEEGRRVVDLIERCYQNRKAMVLPWINPAMEVAV